MTEPDQACARCGRDPAAGYASITLGGVTRRYCHAKPIGGPSERTCYEEASYDLTTARSSGVPTVHIDPEEWRA